jgi:hypothetical protein
LNKWKSSVPITTTLQPVQTKIFQVEDFKSLTFTKQEALIPTTNNWINVLLWLLVKSSNTVCGVVSRRSIDVGKKYYKNQAHSDHQKNNCFVETHTIGGSGENLTGK